MKKKKRKTAKKRTTRELVYRYFGPQAVLPRGILCEPEPDPDPESAFYWHPQEPINRQNSFAFPLNSTKMFKFSLLFQYLLAFQQSVNICLLFELGQTSWLEIKLFFNKNQNGNKLHMHGNSRGKSSCVYCGPESVLRIISDVLVRKNFHLPNRNVCGCDSLPVREVKS